MKLIIIAMKLMNSEYIINVCCKNASVKVPGASLLTLISNLWIGLEKNS